MKTQSPNTFHVNTKANAQAVRQYRPNLPADTSPQMKQFARQTLDLVNSIKDTQTPTSLFAKGDSTGDPIVVPVAAAADNQGTSLGLHLQLGRPGNWLISANVNLQIIGDAGQLFTLALIVGQAPQSHSAQINPSADQIQMVQQSWQVESVSGDEICRLYIKKAAGGGTSQVLPQNTTFTATWQGA